MTDWLCFLLILTFSSLGLFRCIFPSLFPVSMPTGRCRTRRGAEKERKEGQGKERQKGEEGERQEERQERQKGWGKSLVDHCVMIFEVSHSRKLRVLFHQVSGVCFSIIACEFSLRAWSHCGRFFRLSSNRPAFRDRRQGYCRGMRPILVAAARIDNLLKETDYRFCVKLHQRQVRNLFRDAHRSERVKKQVVQFHLSLLEKETCSDLKTLSEGVLEFWISL